MAADWVSLFDKRLCDEIISLTRANMPAFVAAHLTALHDLSQFKCGFAQDTPANVRLSELREQGHRDEELKADLADHLCVSSDRVTVDYWGCYAEVFSGGDPPGSIPDYVLFPHVKEQGYLLLRPEHIERMLASLEQHRRELSLMQEPQLAQLRRWKTQCAEDPGRMVAYFYDA